VLLALFTAVELHAPEPVLPFELLRHRVLGLASLEGFVLGACIYSASSYVPLFVQGAQMGGPREVAWVAAAISVAWTGGSLLGSRVLLKMGFRSAAMVGMGIISAGGLLLMALRLDTPLAVVAVAGLVLGVGLGVCSTAFTVVVQTAVGWEQRGVATATQQFFRAIGGTLWVSVQGAALSATAAAGLASAGMQMGSGEVVRLSDLNTMLEPSARLALTAEQTRLLAQVLEAGLHQVFVLLLAIALVGLGLAWLLPRGRIAAPAQTAPARPARLTNR
jgi:MFS family permease